MDAWKHGRYVDLWSFVHFLSGALIGIGLFWVGLPFFESLILTILLVIAWELYEWLLRIIEVTPNVVLDVLIGLAGFLGAAYWHYGLSMPVSLPEVVLIALFTGILSLWGFWDLIIKGFR